MNIVNSMILLEKNNLFLCIKCRHLSDKKNTLHKRKFLSKFLHMQTKLTFYGI